MNGKKIQLFKDIWCDMACKILLRHQSPYQYRGIIISEEDTGDLHAILSCCILETDLNINVS